jgi:hypothetical protein
MSWAGLDDGDARCFGGRHAPAAGGPDLSARAPLWTWLPGRDSNPNYLIQSQASYR